MEDFNEVKELTKGERVKFLLSLLFRVKRQSFLENFHQINCKRDFIKRLRNSRFDLGNQQGGEKFQMELILEQNQIAKSVLNRTDKVFGDKIGIMGKIFGCWHKQLSRPFTNQNSSYRACLECGAKKHFDTETLKTFGPFYYPPIISLEIH